MRPLDYLFIYLIVVGIGYELFSLWRAYFRVNRKTTDKLLETHCFIELKKRLRSKK